MLTLDSLTERQFERDGRDVASLGVAAIDGTMPDLRPGTWYLNGPGRFHAREVAYRHWLDGDGLIRAVTFGADGVAFASRFVRTRKFVEEESGGRPLFRTFGTAFAGDRLNERGTGLESPANVSILRYGARLLALGEQGQPWEIDPHTLETRGAFTAGGSLSTITPFAAHAKVDARSGELFNFGVSFSPDRPMLNVFRFDAGGRQVFRSRIPLHCSCTIHDFALAASVAVFYASPYVLDMSALHAGATVLAALSWRRELGSRAMVVSRQTGELLASIPVGERYSLHTINSFEEDGLVVLDVVEMPSPIYESYVLPRLFDRPVESTPVRLRLDPARQRLVSREELATTRAPEFPVIEPADAMGAYSTFWALEMSGAPRSGPKFFDRVARFRWDDPERPDAYEFPAGVLVGGEPLIVRDRADKPWLLCQLLDVETWRGGFAAFDAHDVGRGPVARLWLDEPTPMAFHGTFVPSEAGR